MFLIQVYLNAVNQIHDRQTFRTNRKMTRGISEDALVEQAINAFLAQ
jgi:hypothetical protein